MYIWDNHVSEKILIIRGEKQGEQFCPNYLQQQSFQNAQLEEKGMNTDGEKLLDLTFADGVALTTEGVKDMEHQLNTVNEESIKIGLKTHKAQTRFISNIDTTDIIQIDGTEIEKVTNYKYMGQSIATGNKTRQEVSTRIKQDGMFLKSTEKSFWPGIFP